MTIRKKSLIYDIENLAFTIADTGSETPHSLHQVRDICQDGNIDRVARVLGLAYANVITILLPVSSPLRVNVGKDNSAKIHDYIFNLREDAAFKYVLTKERKLKLKETIHEYMVCMVLADWLEITLPEAADVWKYRAEGCLEKLTELVETISAGSFSPGLRRTLSPF